MPALRETLCRRCFCHAPCQACVLCLPLLLLWMLTTLLQVVRVEPVACGTLLASSRRQKQLRYAHTSTASRGVQLASRIAIVASCDSTVVVHRSRSSSQSESGTDPAAAPGANLTRNMWCILRIVVSVVFCVPCAAIRCRLARSAPVIKTDKSTLNFEPHKMCNSFLQF